GRSIVRAVDGGYVIAGSSKSVDGDVSGHHGSVDSTDAWVVKLDADGHVQWQKSLGGSGKDEIDHIIGTFDGGYIGIGTTTSLDGDVSGCHGNAAADIWVVKLDRYGVIQWQKCLGGTSDDMANSIRQMSDSGYIIGASVRSKDGDVSGNTGIDYTAWIVRLDKSGYVQMSHTYNCTAGVTDAYDVLPLPSGEYLVAADANQDGGDFGNVGHANPPNAYMLKVDGTGSVLKVSYLGERSEANAFKEMNGSQFFLETYLWNCYPNHPNSGFTIKNYDTSLNALGSNDNFSYCPNADIYGYSTAGRGSMLLKSNGPGVVAGTTSDTPGLGNHGGVYDGLLASFYPRSWAKCYGGSALDYFGGVVTEDDYTYITAGYSNSNDGDVSGNHGGFDFWVVKLSKVNVIKGAVFLDYNLNGTRDGGEPLVNNVLVQSSLGSTSSGSSTYNGNFYNVVDTGTYTTQVISPLSFYTPSPSTVSSTFHSYNNTDSLSFALQPVPGKRDYSVGIFSRDFPRAGFDASFQITYANHGTDTLINKKVQLIKDPHYTFLSAVPAASSVTGDTITWVLAELDPRQTGSIAVQLHLSPPPTTKLGDTLHTVAVIDSTGDLFPVDNIATQTDIAISSFDPNDKEEAHGGVVYKDDLNKGNALLYTIHFQNTGNDTAFTVLVRDTLDNAKLDPSTVEMVGASHPYQLSIFNGNQLVWTFSSIRLPDSMKNAAGSQGYLVFRVKPRSTVMEGDTIKNTASIYFDYNLPVATPTQKTAVAKLTLPLPPRPVIDGLNTNYCPNTGAHPVKITNIPSPSYQATTLGKVDGVVVSVGADSSILLRTDTLAAGSHVLTVIFSNATGADTSSHAFTVDAQVTPVVDLGSNTTTVTDLSQQVILTATNTAGGGSQPLYTFSKDRGFTSLVQAESSQASASVDPSTLQVGNNSFYVRMKTSSSCYTASTAVDSIVIMRSAVTGIVDVDYPDQAINIYSNPFFGQLQITGLQPIKDYLLTLVSSNGKVVFRKQVSGQQSISIPTGVQPAGVYLMNIYDEKKGRLIGTAKLLSLGR
ncbi:MAG TPA: hypothetical protein VHD83_07865, partial [Puia sp.]|nr:hypothetical protein [Puia sp.]